MRKSYVYGLASSQEVCRMSGFTVIPRYDHRDSFRITSRRIDCRLQELNEEYKARLDACEKLEAASAQLLRRITIAKAKQDKIDTKAKKSETRAQKKARKIEEKKVRGTSDGMWTLKHCCGHYDRSPHADSHAHLYPMRTIRPRHSRTLTNEMEAGVTIKEGSSFLDLPDPASLIERFVPPNKRPRHRIGLFGLWGRKVDTIEWCTASIPLFPIFRNAQLINVP